MPTPLESLVACGTKLWLDSVDPEEVARNRAFGATGATSNPIIIGDLIKTGRFDDRLAKLLREGAARDAIWRGAQRRPNRDRFKSVYSIFVSRLDVYTEKAVPDLSPAAQGMVGIVNAKRLWHLNQKFWADKKLPLKQEIVFASTGTKKPDDPPWKYVEAFAGSDLEDHPPAA